MHESGVSQTGDGPQIRNRILTGEKVVNSKLFNAYGFELCHNYNYNDECYEHNLFLVMTTICNGGLYSTAQRDDVDQLCRFASITKKCFFFCAH